MCLICQECLHDPKPHSLPGLCDPTPQSLPVDAPSSDCKTVLDALLEVVMDIPSWSTCCLARGTVVGSVGWEEGWYTPTLRLPTVTTGVL